MADMAGEKVHATHSWRVLESAMLKTSPSCCVYRMPCQAESSTRMYNLKVDTAELEAQLATSEVGRTPSFDFEGLTESSGAHHA